VIFIRIIYL